MSDKFKCFIGWDKKDALAFEVCAESLLRHASIPIEIKPIYEWRLRYNKLYWRSYIVDESGQMVDRRDRSKFSTDFSFTRFCVPAMCNYLDELVLFCDADMLWRRDIAELLKLVDRTKAVSCVKHDYISYEQEKMFKLKQTMYKRKNWSSLMIYNPSKCHRLTPYAANNWTGEQLHAFNWVDDDDIGELPIEWNYLVGQTDPLTVLDPAVVHYTLGTPDMENVIALEYEDEWKEYAKGVKLHAR